MSEAKLIRFDSDGCDYALCMSLAEARVILYYLLGNARRENIQEHAQSVNPELTTADVKDINELLNKMFISIKTFNTVYHDDIAIDEIDASTFVKHIMRTCI